eukprot:360443-Chlamydomonas_euryale.AAC.2
MREAWAPRAFQAPPAWKVCLGRNLINCRQLPRSRGAKYLPSDAHDCAGHSRPLTTHGHSW